MARTLQRRHKNFLVEARKLGRKDENVPTVRTGIMTWRTERPLTMGNNQALQVPRVTGPLTMGYNQALQVLRVIGPLTFGNEQVLQILQSVIMMWRTECPPTMGNKQARQVLCRSAL